MAPRKKKDEIINSATVAMPFRVNNFAPKRDELPIQTSMRIRNATFAGGSAGNMGPGDRGSWMSVPDFTGNPYDSQDYVYRWRQYCHLYELSWEARKIVRIPVEDALRKPWIAEGISEKMAEAVQHRLDALKFTEVLKRSLMLERLLGGCLTFFGLESTQDDPSKVYHAHEGAKLRFCNAIPISRISRVSWDTNPLSENYMRPDLYLVNGQELHVSRALVWDGEPLFDPYDFALTNFRSNLAGFGPSKLAPVWDDIVKAVGTRQAAFQLIQTNNAILIAINDLQDLTSTDPGLKNLEQLKQVANQMSLYRAAIVDGEKATINQHSASFGSVPELIITFIQILSAASDIPATRFLGQAPGGLNATGESDLENYYNVIDAYQQQRIVPALRRVYDVVGYQMFGQMWHEERKHLTFKFPPLWNQSELEEAQTTAQNIDNVMKLHEAGLIEPEKVIEELNIKGALSVKLDNDDLANLEAMRDQQEVDVEAEIEKLKAAGRTTVDMGANAEKRLQNTATPESLMILAGYDPSQFDVRQFLMGYSVEQEHADLTGGDPTSVAKIVLAHLTELPDYYSRLERMESSAKKILNYITESNGKWTVHAESGKSLGEYDSKDEAEKRLKQVDYFKSQNRKKPSDEDLKKAYNGGFIATEQDNPYSEEGTPELRAEWQRGWDAMIVSKKHQNSISLDPLPEPTDAQITAGNYQKHHLRLHGLDISIENPRGSIRKGVGSDGVVWEVELPAHYGYVKRTEGADGDHVDVYLGGNELSELVFVIDQNLLETGAFDEHKCILGCNSMAEARALYVAAFNDGRGANRLGAITPMHITQFKRWLESGDTTKPFGGDLK